MLRIECLDPITALLSSVSNCGILFHQTLFLDQKGAMSLWFALWVVLHVVGQGQSAFHLLGASFNSWGLPSLGHLFYVWPIILSVEE